MPVINDELLAVGDINATDASEAAYGHTAFAFGCHYKKAPGISEKRAPALVFGGDFLLKEGFVV